MTINKNKQIKLVSVFIEFSKKLNLIDSLISINKNKFFILIILILSIFIYNRFSTIKKYKNHKTNLLYIYSKELQIFCYYIF